MSEKSKKVFTYYEAFTKLELFVSDLEDGSIQLEEVAAKAQQANECIAICENKLWKIEGSVGKALLGSE